MSSNTTWDKNVFVFGPRNLVGSSTEVAVFFRIIFVLLLRAGFVLVQIGSIPTENVYRIMLQNLVDIAVSLISYGLIGFALNHGSKSLEGIVGYGAWIDSDIKEVSLHQAGYGFAAVLVGTGIITTVFCTRLHLLAVATISFFYSAFLYPIVSHWLWMKHGWMQLRETTVNNYAGGLSVYTTAGTFAFVGAVFLRRRLLRLSELSELSVIGVDISKNTIAGYMFVLIGFIVFSLPTPEEEYSLKHKHFDGVLFTNSALALSASGLMTILLDVTISRRHTITYWALLKYLQAANAGVVALSCSINTISPLASFIMGVTAGAAFFLFSTVIHHSLMEDNCNMITSTLICSFLASLLSDLISKNQTMVTSLLNKKFSWQLACYFIIFTVTFISAILIFLILYVSNRLKSRSEKLNHKRAIVMQKSRGRVSVKKLFTALSGVRIIEPGIRKAGVSESGDEDVIVGISIEREPSQNTETDTILSQESSLTKFSTSEDGRGKNRKKQKKYLNLQESATQIKKSRK